MFEDPHYANFSRQEFLDVVTRCAFLGDDLDGDVGLMSLGVGQLHGGVLTLVERSYDAIAVCIEHRLSSMFVAFLVIGRVIRRRLHDASPTASKPAVFSASQPTIHERTHDVAYRSTNSTVNYFGYQRFL